MVTLRALISPFFLIRYYLRRDISALTTDFKFVGSMLDIGCGQKPYRSLFANITEYKGIDFKTYSVNKDFSQAEPDFYFADTYTNNNILPFEHASFDHSCAFQVLEHHPKPFIFLQEMARITKAGGWLVLSFPLIGGLHEKPHDYQRFTEYGFKELVESVGGLSIEKILPQGNLLATLIIIMNEGLNTFAARGKAQYVLAAFAFALMLPLQWIVYLLDPLLKPKEVFINYLILCRKS